MSQFFSFCLGALILSSPAGETFTHDNSQVPRRDEIPDEYKWHLADIYASDDAWNSDFTKLKNLLPAISQYKGKLAESSKTLLECLKFRDQAGIIAGKLYAYARLHRDENSAEAEYQALTGKIEALLAETGAATAFIEPEIITIPDERLASFRKQEEGLKDYNFYFDDLARQKQHVLSPAEEEILSRVSEVTQAPENIFNMLAHADLTFPEITDEKGRNVQLSEGRFRTYIMSADRRVRQQAFVNLFNTYKQYRNTFAAALNGNIKKNIFYAKTRKYKNALAAALEPDNVPLAVYDNIIATVHNNLSPLHRYVALKKRVLALNEIHMYDLYAPLVLDVNPTYEYRLSLELIKEALAPLGEDYGAILQKGFSAGWIDVYENKGKQTGAYSWGVYSVHPFVLLNYNRRYDDVSTIAHEMGHAIHSYYSQANQPYASSSYTIFSAEVASTTNEVLLIDYMLKKTTDKRLKMFLINQYLESIRATVYRQTMFAEFEKIIYEKSENGETITADLLDAIWHDLNVQYYGPEIVVDKEISAEWSRIPHFYWSFYVYKYVTGYAAATALADKLINGGSDAQKKYITFLKSGGSDYSLNLLKQAGVDMSSPEAIEITLAKFGSLIDEFEKLILEQ